VSTEIRFGPLWVKSGSADHVDGVPAHGRCTSVSGPPAVESIGAKIVRSAQSRMWKSRAPMSGPGLLLSRGEARFGQRSLQRLDRPPHGLGFFAVIEAARQPLAVAVASALAHLSQGPCLIGRKVKGDFRH
jgi:hypothetical protein